jgi:hypothetical protein
MKNADPIARILTPKNVEKEALFTINEDDLGAYVQRPIGIRFGLEDVYISQLANASNSLELLKKIDFYTEKISPRLNFRTLRFFSEGSTKTTDHIKKILKDLRVILEELNNACIGESSTNEIEELFSGIDKQIDVFGKEICTITCWQKKINTMLSGLKKINTFFYEKNNKVEMYVSVTEKIKNVKNEFEVFEKNRDLFLNATQQYAVLLELLTDNCRFMFDFYKKIVSKLDLPQSVEEASDLKSLLLLLSFDANSFNKKSIKIVSKQLDDVLKFLLTLKNKEAVKKNIYLKNIDVLKGLYVLCDSNKKLAINDDGVMVKEDKKLLENTESTFYVYVPLMWNIVNYVKKVVDDTREQEEILLQKSKQREIEKLLLACEISSSGSKSNKNKNNKNKNNKNKKTVKSKKVFVASGKKSSTFQQKTTTTNTTSSSDTIVSSLISKETFEGSKNFNIADFVLFHSIACSSVDKKHQLLAWLKLGLQSVIKC